MPNNVSIAQTENQITLTLPPDIEPPQFKLFDRVRLRLRHSRCECNRVGVVTGMCYTPFLTALKADTSMGWQYAIDWVYGASQAAALEVSEPVENYDEDSLELVEG